MKLKLSKPTTWKLTLDAQETGLTVVADGRAKGRYRVHYKKTVSKQPITLKEAFDTAYKLIGETHAKKRWQCIRTTTPQQQPQKPSSTHRGARYRVPAIAVNPAEEGNIASTKPIARRTSPGRSGLALGSRR